MSDYEHDVIYDDSPRFEAMQARAEKAEAELAEAVKDKVKAERDRHWCYYQTTLAVLRRVRTELAEAKILDHTCTASVYDIARDALAGGGSERETL